MTTVSNAYNAPFGGGTSATRHARTLHVAPEVADLLHLGGSGGALRLDGAPLRTKALPRTSLRSTNNFSGGAPLIVVSSRNNESIASSMEHDKDDDAATRKSSAETQRTLVGSTAVNKDDAAKSTFSSAPASSSSSSSAAQQPRRIHAAPLNVSADVQAMLSGRMRGGGALSLGGEPLRATAKGKVTKAESSRSDRANSTSSSTSSTSEGDDTRKQAKGKMSFFRAFK